MGGLAGRTSQCGNRMPLTVSPSQSQVYAALVAYLQGVLPSNVKVIRGLPNRTAMPVTPPGFVMIQALDENRLRMAIDTFMTGGNSPPTTSTITEGIEVPFQIDCYGPNSQDWASIISSTFQDTYGCNALAPNCQPLYCNRAHMVPLTNEELQLEQRWSLEASLEYSPVITVTQQYAGDLTLVMKNVEVLFPN
jgi:hypothetical protein